MNPEQDKREPDDVASALAAVSIAAGDPTGWFEELYLRAGRGEAELPWDRGTAHPLLVDWATGRVGAGARALVVGCGPGHDAEYLAQLGFSVTAFDISPSAIEQARARHAGSGVTYTVADLLDLPSAWPGTFDLVVEAMTVQVHAADTAITRDRGREFAGRAGRNLAGDRRLPATGGLTR